MCGEALGGGGRRRVSKYDVRRNAKTRIWTDVLALEQGFGACVSRGSGSLCVCVHCVLCCTNCVRHSFFGSSCCSNHGIVCQSLLQCEFWRWRAL